VIKLFSLCLPALFTAAAQGQSSIIQSYSIQTVAGSNSSGDGGAATAALLVQAEGVTIDGLGNIYVADAGDNRVRKISRNGIIETIAGTGVAGFAGDGGPATTARLNHPYGVALDLAGNLYIADLGNARVRKVGLTGLINTVAGGGSSIFMPGMPANGAALMSPRNVTVDFQGVLYISDFDAHTVYRVSPAGVLTILAGTGKSGFSGDGSAATLARISYPAGLVTDVNGNIYIADSGNARVRRVWYGAISTVAVNVSSPTGVSVDSTGHLYVASSSVASRTRVTSPAALIVDAIAGEDVASDPGGVLYVATQRNIQKFVGTTAFPVAGTPNYATFGDGGPATAARIGGPVAIALATNGEMYIAEQSANRIRKVTANGYISILAGDSAQAKAPSGVAVDAVGTVYFSDTGNNRVRRISAGSVLSTVLDKLNAPTCLRSAADGSLYVCDSGNDRVVKIGPTGAVSVAASVARPAGLAIAKDGTLYVSTGSQVVQVSAAGTTTVVEALGSPGGLAFDGTGGLIISEGGKNRILKLGAAGIVTVLAGTGHAGYGGDGGAAEDADLNNPADVAIDKAGNIVVADTGNNCIRELTVAAGASAVTAPPVTVVNAASLLQGPLAPNEIVTIFGNGFDPAHTSVTFDSAPATVFYAGTGQLNVLVPASVKPNATTVVGVLANGSPVGAAIMNTVLSVPAVFTLGTGTGQAAALNEDGSLNSEANPAARGSIVVLYLTGDGLGASPASVQIGNYAVELLYAGPAPGFMGLMQINARVPQGLQQSGLLGVLVTAGGVPSQPGVTLAVH
jgi:uncharacterized protein (TIGR03437 family)